MKQTSEICPAFKYQSKLAFFPVLGAFLIPYFVMVFICGIPLLYMEFAIGQYTRLGPVHAFAKICPLFKGEWQRFVFSRELS